MRLSIVSKGLFIFFSCTQCESPPEVCQGILWIKIDSLSEVSNSLIILLREIICFPPFMMEREPMSTMINYVAEVCDSSFVFIVLHICYAFTQIGKGILGFELRGIESTAEICFPP